MNVFLGSLKGFLVVRPVPMPLKSNWPSGLQFGPLFLENVLRSQFYSSLVEVYSWFWGRVISFYKMVGVTSSAAVFVAYQSGESRVGPSSNPYLVLPDEKHDRTFGIKCCRTKSTTGLLELSVAGRKARLNF
ncbi:hypothetical protein RCL_jg17606.t1 [Rhizophagus clarus]|uniref:Uncharacterized protein n=1 Tax=Rhizophagus clarus TaxID=94130 RepID=A0A8H3L852_9GLOM|nr:hypothetical protein RCL_jg17606.t1 [Rhizophagus clarus]